MGLVDTAKDIYDLLKKSATVELQEKIMRLREEAMDMQSENISLKERIKELEELLNVKQNLKFDGKVYWIELPDKGRDGPYCQKCKDSNDKLVRLQRREFKGFEIFACLECKATYRLPRI